MHLDGKHLVAKSYAMEQVDSQLQLQSLLKSKTQSQVKLVPIQKISKLGNSNLPPVTGNLPPSSLKLSKDYS